MSAFGTGALVTGASSGIGEAFARALAAHSVNLLLTSLPEDEGTLNGIARELSARHHVRAEVVTTDLSDPAGVSRLMDAADALAFEPDTLVNSAGFGVIGRFDQASLERQLAMIRVNVEALVALTGRYLPRMVARRKGTIINVASTAGLMPVPYFAAYAASKAFVVSFSEALWAENRAHGVRVVAACPGPVGTRFHERAAGDDLRARLQVSAVVQAAFKGLERGRPVVVQRVLPFGVVFAALSAPVAPRRVRLLAIHRIARWFFKQS